MRGDVYEFRSPPGRRGHEQRGQRFAVIVQSDDLPLSTTIVAPTSTSSRPARFRCPIELGGVPTFVLLEQMTAIDPERLGRWVGRLTQAQLRQLDHALRLVVALD